MLTEAPQIPRIKSDVTSHRFSPFPTQSHSSFFSLLPCLLFLFQFSLLSWAQSAEQQSLVELLWVPSHGSYPGINPPAAGTKTAAGGFTPAVNDSSFLYHDSSLLCHVWTQIHLSCCIYVRSNRDHCHNNTCIITKGTLRSSNAIKMMNETLANTFPGVWTLTNLNDA